MPVIPIKNNDERAATTPALEEAVEEEDHCLDGQKEQPAAENNSDTKSENKNKNN